MYHKTAKGLSVCTLHPCSLPSSRSLSLWLCFYLCNAAQCSITETGEGGTGVLLGVVPTAQRP